MATRPANVQNTKSSNMGRGNNFNSSGNVGNNDSSSDGYISVIILLILLFFVILPFEVYLYTVVLKIANMCSIYLGTK